MRGTGCDLSKVHNDRVPFGGYKEREASSPEPAPGWLHDARCERGGDDRVDRVPSELEHRSARLAGERVICSHDAAWLCRSGLYRGRAPTARREEQEEGYKSRVSCHANHPLLTAVASTRI